MACGVIGIAMREGKEHLIRDYARSGLVVVNHRGEESHGIAMVSPDGRIESRREKGLVRDSDVFDDPLNSGMFVGHTRYATSSSNGIKNTQPVVGGRKSDTPTAIVANGDLVNAYTELRAVVRTNKPMSDTRILGRLVKQKLKEHDDAVEAIRSAMLMCKGAYSLAILVGGKSPMIVAMRDPLGYMPLSIGENDDGYFVASESVAFGSKYFNADHAELAPGHMAIITPQGLKVHTFAQADRTQHCWFQWVYMAKPSSVIAGVSVYDVRETIGRKLAETYKIEVDFVSPVPDSGRIFTYGYANATGVPMIEALMRDRYEAKRSFMQDGTASRIAVARKKLDVMGADGRLRGKRLLIIDDSLVRGNTTKEAIAQLRRETGVAEVHVGIASPPIRHQCVYGLDFYKNELIAVGKSTYEIASAIGADSLHYLSSEDLVSAIGLQERDICMACVNGSYAQKVELLTREEKRG